MRRAILYSVIPDLEKDQIRSYMKEVMRLYEGRQIGRDAFREVAKRALALEVEDSLKKKILRKTKRNSSRISGY